MFEETLTLQNKLGLHARPSARLAKTASLFRSTITITHEKHTVDAKSILGLMTMALPCGSVVTISADGPDEKDAVQTIAELFRDRFGEDE
ncbi:HPr family phosphocarrier protein [uncultured Sutterella sp.]|uniref:HPr family phosphocarrier protein n=1 Tax=uncultured Sutterella sp. TaxID=286133 RepID=UPI002603DDAC|nr:HPr family phosphocarrier protein [uncultured Sutterella sp.]